MIANCSSLDAMRLGRKLIPDWIRVRRQPKTLSRNIESASGEAQALDILGKPPCHRNEDNAITSQTLRVSTIQRRFPHIQPNYSRKICFLVMKFRPDTEITSKAFMQRHLLN
ncbi:hypothetical protein O6H91_16G008000 [Diphasiastrum complanatum]|uniref:Uncharacterized protein n=1 Tax=Diphasiastrum complanatum TaxID=34168 RepID=A0ACC2B9S6_DIPCM|nr:hypothetical protein O6H91_16G008000 [Diphasiastrum complanatum]